MSKFSDRLKEARSIKGVTQKEAAIGIEINETQYQKYESDKRMPSCETLINICKYFNVSADYLLDIESNYLKAPREEIAALRKENDKLKTAFESLKKTINTLDN